MPKPMPQRENNLFGYLGYEYQSFVARPLGDVDSLVLACVSYFQLPAEALAARGRDGMALHELYRAEWLEAMTGGLWDPVGLARLLSLLVASPRFRGLRVCDYVDKTDVEAEQQFSACTLRFPNGDAYVSFRGTDNSIVGWKEDFNMAFETGVPSQLAARDYLERIAPTVEGRLFAGGHSKGGNLAVYAASTCDDATAAKLVRAYSHDGPGFTKEAMAGDTWGTRAGLVSKTVPKSSFIGMFFENQEDYAVVDSTEAGAMQHDPFSWVVEGTDFVRADELDRGQAFLDESLNSWIGSMTHEEREGFVNSLFSILYASGEDTFAGLSNNWQVTVPAMLEALSGFEPEQRAHLTRALELLLKSFIPQVDRAERAERAGIAERLGAAERLELAGAAERVGATGLLADRLSAVVSSDERPSAFAERLAAWFGGAGEAPTA